MREIKFRVWNGSKMLQQHEIAFVGGIATTEALTLKGVMGILNLTYVVMQFIGKNKEGQDVYEGDILIDDEYPEDGVSYAVVEWEESEKIVGWLVNPWGNEKEYFTDYRVAGNIYQNKDLLIPTSR